jgi:hypothetical protein
VTTRLQNVSSKEMRTVLAARDDRRQQANITGISNTEKVQIAATTGIMAQY